MEHVLIGKPLRTFPGHALAANFMPAGAIFSSRWRCSACHRVLPAPIRRRRSKAATKRPSAQPVRRQKRPKRKIRRRRQTRRRLMRSPKRSRRRSPQRSRTRHRIPRSASPSRRRISPSRPLSCPPRRVRNYAPARTNGRSSRLRIRIRYRCGANSPPDASRDERAATQVKSAPRPLQLRRRRGRHVGRALIAPRSWR